MTDQDGRESPRDEWPPADGGGEAAPAGGVPAGEMAEGGVVVGEGRGARPVNRRRPVRLARRRRSRGPRRGWIIGVVVGLLIIGGLVDRAGSGHVAAAAPPPAMPTAADTSALSSSWFCGGATGTKGSAPGTLVIANPTAHALHARIVPTVTSGAAPAASALTVPAGARVTAPEPVAGANEWVAATVVLDGGGGVVEQQVHGGLGLDVTPCATTGSAKWYLPSGTTLRNAGETVLLYNPYSGTAIVNLSFVTDQGPEAPNDFQAIIVPPGHVVAENLATHLRRRVSIATSVTAQTGRVVAWATETIAKPSAGTPIYGQTSSNPLADPAPAVGGLTSTLGAPSVGTSWYWPDGVAGDGVAEQYIVYNPGSATASLRLTVDLDQGGKESFPLTVGPQSVASVSTTTQIRVPAGVAHDATLVATNGVGVVAERSVSATSPSTRSGLGELIGAQVAAPDWVLGAGGSKSADEWVEIQNPGGKSVVARLSHQGSAVGSWTVPAGGRVALHLTGPSATAAAAGPLTVAANGPVVAERDLYANSGPGIALAFGVPERGSGTAGSLAAPGA